MSSELDDLRALLTLTTLPAVPEVLPRLWELHARGDAGTVELAGVVETNPQLASDLVHLVSSLESRSVRNLHDAVRVLGPDHTVTFCLTMLVQRELVTFAPRNSRLDRLAYWNHSVGTASATMHLADLVPDVNPVHAYATGLLHDVGLLAVDLVAPHLCGSPEPGRRDGKADSLGRTHGVVGRIVAERWELPDEVLDGIAWHHEPESAPAPTRPLACLVKIGDSIMADPRFPGLAAVTRTGYERALSWLGLEEKDAVAACESAAESFRQRPGGLDFGRCD